MTLKTFNLDKKVYEEFSKHCKSNGISMSKKVENFIKSELEIIKGKSSKVDSKAIKKIAGKSIGHELGRYIG